MTVAIRGHFAERMRTLSESRGMSLAKLLKDACAPRGVRCESLNALVTR